MPQFARPSSTIYNNGFYPVGGDTVWATIDEETPSDADYCQTSLVYEACLEIGLSSLQDPKVSEQHHVRYRLKVVPTSVDWSKVVLKQGGADLVTWSHDPPPALATTFEQTLSAAQADSITDYTDLRLSFSFGSAVLQGVMGIYWAEMTVPLVVSGRAVAGQVVAIGQEAARVHGSFVDAGQLVIIGQQAGRVR